MNNNASEYFRNLNVTFTLLKPVTFFDCSEVLHCIGPNFLCSVFFENSFFVVENL